MHSLALRARESYFPPDKPKSQVSERVGRVRFGLELLAGDSCLRKPALVSSLALQNEAAASGS